MYIYLSISLTLYLSISLFLYLSLYLSIYLSLSICIYIYIYTDGNLGAAAISHPRSGVLGLRLKAESKV